MENQHKFCEAQVFDITVQTRTKDSQLKPTNMLQSPSQYEFTQQLKAFQTADYKCQHPIILLFK